MTVAGERMRYVYVGNVLSSEHADTRCPDCGTTVITRRGYQTRVQLDPGALCPNCKAALPVVL